jgi:hypothetical protein
MIKEKRLGIGKVIKPEGFSKGFDALPHGLTREAKKVICASCYWTSNTFNLKKKGKMLFRIFEIEQIEKYFESQNINAWTGEHLN